jgi:hypothetical protein
MNAGKATYRVQDSSQNIISRHHTKTAAIKAASKVKNAYVFMDVVSGSYRSATMIYPFVGVTHGHHSS